MLSCRDFVCTIVIVVVFCLHPHPLLEAVCELLLRHGWRVVGFPALLAGVAVCLDLLLLGIGVALIRVLVGRRIGAFITAVSIELRAMAHGSSRGFVGDA